MSAMVPPSELNTVAAEVGLKAMKKIKNAIPSQVRTFLIMAGPSPVGAGDGQRRGSTDGISFVAQCEQCDRKADSASPDRASEIRRDRAGTATALRTRARVAHPRRGRAERRAPRESNPRLRATLPHRATFLWPHSRRHFDLPGT